MNVIKKEGVWRLFDRQATLILTDERQLQRIAEHPELPLFDDEGRGFSGEKRGLYAPGTTLDTFMKEAAERGCERVEISYDFFFGGSTRENYPDSDLTVRAFKVVHDYARKYGMTFGASLISPLDLGGGYRKKYENTGFTWQFQEAAIDNGGYRVLMRRQRQWYNNKGPIQLELNRVMAVAFHEEQIGDTPLYFVDENAIHDISASVHFTSEESTYKLSPQGYAYNDMIVYGETSIPAERVLIVVEYRTPELDYFDAFAPKYIRSVINLHANHGIRYQGFYSDEMHIQFDWDLDTHFEETEITTRYVTPAFINAYADKYGEKYRDFLKYMVYFAYNQHRFLPGCAHEPSQHVMGRDSAGAIDTWLFRKRYFEMVSERVVKLSLEAKAYAERLFGAPIMTRAHATWQESPTCDHFSDDFSFQAANRKEVTRYDYDKPYVWGSSIRENISACCDYFRWNEFLSGSGTDHAEGGNADRNYYSQALAASFGSLNPFKKAYAACWGSPDEVVRRFSNVGATYGTGDISHSLVQNMEHRLSDVLMLYPTELNFTEERFGSWMVQYGYCNYITEEKLLKYGRATEDGRLLVNGRAYRTLVVLYEMFVDRRICSMMEEFLLNGGRLLWTSVPGVRYEDGTNAEGHFQSVFWLKKLTLPNRPLHIGDQEITFEGILSGIPPMKVLTDYLPDYAYPVVPEDGVEIVARAGDHILGVTRTIGRGRVMYLGFRPRDDQSGSLGTDVDTLFRILKAINAYAPDSLEILSRPAGSPYIMNRFPNGAVSMAGHYRTFYEDWYGRFFRDQEADQKILAGRKLPSTEIRLSDYHLDGHTIRYQGTDALTYLYHANRLLGFAGQNTTGIEIDRHSFTLTETPADIAFALVEKANLPSQIGELMLVRCSKAGQVTLPNLMTAPVQAGVCELDFFATAYPIRAQVSEDRIAIYIDASAVGKWIAIYTTQS